MINFFSNQLFRHMIGFSETGDAQKISSSVDPNGRYPNIEVYFHNLVQHIIYYQNQGGIVMEKK